MTEEQMCLMSSVLTSQEKKNNKQTKKKPPKYKHIIFAFSFPPLTSSWSFFLVSCHSHQLNVVHLNTRTYEKNQTSLNDKICQVAYWCTLVMIMMMVQLFSIVMKSEEGGYNLTHHQINNRLNANARFRDKCQSNKRH